jgi:hypothetical protein
MVKKSDGYRIDAADLAIPNDKGRLAWMQRKELETWMSWWACWFQITSSQRFRGYGGPSGVGEAEGAADNEIFNR